MMLFVRVQCTEPTKKTMVVVIYDETAAKLNETSQLSLSMYLCVFLDRSFGFLIQFTKFLCMSLLIILSIPDFHTVCAYIHK